MNFEKKVKSMTIKEIVMAMIEGLENPTTEVNMETYGEVGYETKDGVKDYDKPICFGCAATNTIAHIGGVVFSPDNISENSSRAEAVKAHWLFLDRFESAINLLRSSDFEDSGIYNYNHFARQLGIAVIPEKFLDFKLPVLETDNYKEWLPAWRDFANKL